MRLRYTILLVLALVPSLALSKGALPGQDPSQGLDWHELLKEPDPDRLMALATWYEKAEGVRHDYGRARQLYCAAARLGYLPAQIRLAWMYAVGLGAPQDRELAGAWLRVAAAKGSVQAKKFLALLDYPPRARKPRCTYTSRYDEYALATLPSWQPQIGPLGDGEPISSWPGGNAITDGAGDPTRRQIEAWVRELAPRYGLDSKLVLAIIQIESNFNPRARSSKNAWGLMQLIPDTAARFGVRDNTHPIQNLHGGMAYLRWLLAFFQGDLQLALAGYNAGEGAVKKYRGIPPYAETKKYVRKVIRAYGRTTHPLVNQELQPSPILDVDKKPGN